MSDRVRVATSHQPAEDLLLELAAIVSGKPKARLAGEAAVSTALQVLSGPTPHSADDDPRVRDWVDQEAKLRTKLDDLRAQFDEAGRREDAGEVRAALDPQMRKVAKQLHAAREKLELLRGQVTRERAERRARELEEGLPGLVEHVAGTGQAYRDATASLVAFVQEHGTDAGLIRELMNAFDATIPEHVARVRAVAAKLLEAGHRNGRVRVRIIGVPGALRGRDAKGFRELREAGDVPREERRELEVWAYNLGASDVFFTTRVARELERLRLVEPAPEPESPAAPPRLEPVRLLVQIPPNNKGETIWVATETAAQYVAKQWAEPVAAGDVTPAAAAEPRVLAKITQSWPPYSVNDVASLDVATFEFHAARGMCESVDGTPMPARVKHERPALPESWADYTPRRGGPIVLVDVLENFGPYVAGRDQIGLDPELAEYLGGLGWVRVTVRPEQPTEG